MSKMFDLFGTRTGTHGMGVSSQGEFILLRNIFQTNECFLLDRGLQLAFATCIDQALIGKQGTPEEFHQGWRVEQRRASKIRKEKVYAELTACCDKRSSQ